MGCAAGSAQKPSGRGPAGGVSAEVVRTDDVPVVKGPAAPAQDPKEDTPSTQTPTEMQQSDSEPQRQRWSQDVSNAALALVTGRLGEEPAKMKLLRGTFLEMSGRVAQVNRAFFRDKVVEINQKFGRDYIQEVQTEREKFVDDYGRVTYFVVKIGAHTLPQYQPGTPMFASGVRSDSQLEVYAKDCQQNGPILGLGCATYLCEVHCRLVQAYNAKCTERRKSDRQSHADCMQEALEETLVEMCLSDVNEHGRLIEMMGEYIKTLCDVGVTEERRHTKLKTCCMMKDIAVGMNRTGLLQASDFQLMMVRQVTQGELDRCMEARQKEKSYRPFHPDNGPELVTTYRDGIMTKKKLVPDDPHIENRFRQDVYDLSEQLLDKVRLVSAHPTKADAAEIVPKAVQEKQLYDEYLQANDLVKVYQQSLRHLNESLFVAGKLPDKFHDGQRLTFEPVRRMASIMPFLIGTALAKVKAADLASDAKLHKRLNEFAGLLPMSCRESAAEQLTMKLTLLRRDFLKCILRDDLQPLINMPYANVTDTCKDIGGLFGLATVNPEEVVAIVDFMLVLASALGLSDEVLKPFRRMPEEECSLRLVEHLVSEFTAAQRVSTLAKETFRVGEKPLYFKVSDALDDDLFDKYPAIPSCFRKRDATPQREWEENVLRVMVQMQQPEFSALLEIADPKDPRRRKLYELLMIATERRQNPPSPLEWCQPGNCVIC